MSTAPVFQDGCVLYAPGGGLGGVLTGRNLSHHIHSARFRIEVGCARRPVFVGRGEGTAESGSASAGRLRARVLPGGRLQERRDVLVEIDGRLLLAGYRRHGLLLLEALAR